MTIVAFSSNVFAGTVSVGITASLLDVEASGTETDKLTATGANVTDTSVRNKSVSADTVTGSLFAEFTSDTSWPMTFGFEYTPGTADISGSLSRTDTELSNTASKATLANSVIRTASADANNFSTVYFEAPMYGALYVRAGFSSMDIDVVTTSDGDASSSYTDNLSLNGTNLGIGFKGNTAAGTLWKIAYEQTSYDSFSIQSVGNSVNANSSTITGDADTKGVRLSLAKSF
tara:strand:+ start:216 stop:908 length:693 start_codon:yes stop_codon:yes gene_type:complete